MALKKIHELCEKYLCEAHKATAIEVGKADIYKEVKQIKEENTK